MLELLEFIFQSFWHFAGIVVLISLVGVTIIGTAEQIFNKKK